MDIQVFEVDAGRLLARLGEQVAEQQSEAVAIGADGVWAHSLLVHEPVGEERLEGRGDGRHRETPHRSTRSAARASSSGVADKYQYVLAGTNGSQNCS